MLKLIVQFLIIFFFWKSNSKKKGSMWVPSSFLIGLYLISSFLGIFVVGIEGFYDILSPSYWIPMLTFDLCVIAFLFPFKLFDEASVNEIKLPSLSILNAFSTALIILSAYAIFYYASTVNFIFALSSLGEARDALYAGEEYVESGIMNTIASVSASLYVFDILLFFVYCTIPGSSKRRALLLLASVSEPLHIMSYVGRDGVVFWIFSFVFLYLIFRPYIDNKIKKSIRKYFIIGATVLLIPFVLISISRFDSSSTGTAGSLVSYMGMGFVNGPLFYGLDNKFLTHGYGFPLYFELFNVKGPTPVGMVQVGDWKSWNFSTFVVSFYRNFGPYGLAVSCFLMFVVFYSIFKRKLYRMDFSKLFIYILYFQIFSQGVFYFKQYTRGGNLFIVICFIFYFVFKFLPLGNNYIIHRIQNE